MHTMLFVRNTYLEELFDHIASQSMFIWDFHQILQVSSLQKTTLQYACFNCAKSTLKCIINFEQVFCP